MLSDNLSAYHDDSRVLGLAKSSIIEVIWKAFQQIIMKLKYLFPFTFFSLFICNVFANNLESIKKGVEHHKKSFLNFSSITTNRLIIRKMKMTDIDDLFVFTSDPEMLKYSPIYDLSENKEGLSQYIKKVLKNYKDGLPDYWAIESKKEHTVIGIISLDIFSKNRGDISYAISRKHWGNGFAAEAAKAIIDFGFKNLSLKRIEATVDPRNIASIKVLRKCGMKFEGLLKSYSFSKEKKEFCDRKIYAITR